MTTDAPQAEEVQDRKRQDPTARPDRGVFLARPPSPSPRTTSPSPRAYPLWKKLTAPGSQPMFTLPKRPGPSSAGKLPRSGPPSPSILKLRLHGSWKPSSLAASSLLVTALALETLTLKPNLCVPDWPGGTRASTASSGLKQWLLPAPPLKPEAVALQLKRRPRKRKMPSEQGSLPKRVSTRAPSKPLTPQGWQMQTQPLKPRCGPSIPKVLGRTPPSSQTQLLPLHKSPSKLLKSSKLHCPSEEAPLQDHLACAPSTLEQP